MKDKKVFIIAEAGVNHNGDIKKALKLVDIAKTWLVLTQSNFSSTE